MKELSDEKNTAYVFCTEPGDYFYREVKKDLITQVSSSLDITDFYPKSSFENVYRGWDEIGSYIRKRRSALPMKMETRTIMS